MNKEWHIVIKGNNIAYYSYVNLSYLTFEEAFENAKIAMAQYQKSTIEKLRITKIEEL